MDNVIALDPSETWQLDFSKAVLEQRLEIRKHIEKEAEEKLEAVRATAPPEHPAPDAAAARELLRVRAVREEAERELAGYLPGSGPVFLVGHIPGAKKAAIDALGRSVRGIADLEERALADFRWAREVVRWSVRGHAGLRRRDGTEVAFATTAERFDGEPFDVVAKATIEVYAASRILAELALFIVLGQQLEEVRKNG